jgi:hypothetical protein
MNKLAFRCVKQKGKDTAEGKTETNFILFK